MLGGVHDTSIRSHLAATTYSSLALISKSEDWIRRRFPLYAKLLHVNDSISLNDLVYKSSHFMLVHGPNFIETVLITLLKTFELILEFLELLCELLVIICKLDILLLEIFALLVKLFFDSSKNVLVPSLLGLESIDSIRIDLFPFLKHLMIEL